MAAASSAPPTLSAQRFMNEQIAAKQEELRGVERWLEENADKVGSEEHDQRVSRQAELRGEVGSLG